MAALSVTIPHFFIFNHLADRLAETVSILGVEIFFVLSGYVLAPQIISFVVERPNIRNLGIFLVRRWMRTIPPYLIALLVMSASAHELLTQDFFRYTTYTQNLFWQSNALDYFSVAWSLSVEEWFYLVFPPFFMIIAAVVPGKSSVIAGFGFVLLITLCRSAFGDYAQWGSEVRRVVAFRMDAIAWGFLLNLMTTRTSLLMRISTSNALIGLTITLLSSVALTLALAESASNLIEHAFPLYSAAFGASAIILTLKASAIFQTNLFLARIGDFLGRISYSMYLFHLLVLSALALVEGPLGWPLSLGVYLAITVVVAALMYTGVEAPILAARPHFRDRPAILSRLQQTNGRAGNEVADS
jgi:peptidoglycan/LPS O-acetylase OafA/YrhL